MKTSLGGPPWLVVGWPKPSPGNITASIATNAATTATAVEALGAEKLFIALFLLLLEPGISERAAPEAT
jgi:hypothetical protein